MQFSSEHVHMVERGLMVETETEARETEAAETEAKKEIEKSHTNLILFVFHEMGLAHTVLRYLDVISLYNSTPVCKIWNDRILGKYSDHGLWGPLCREKGITSTAGATRTRGKRPWKDIYLSNVCINCYDTGHLDPSTSRSTSSTLASSSSLSSSLTSSSPYASTSSNAALSLLPVQQRGIVVVDVEGGSSLKRSYQQFMPIGAFGSRIALCSTCLDSVVNVPRHADRQKLCLQRLKRRKQGSCMLVWNNLINKLPTRNDTHPEQRGGAKVNDFLLKRIMS